MKSYTTIIRRKQTTLSDTQKNLTHVTCKTMHTEWFYWHVWDICLYHANIRKRLGEYTSKN
jgi:hypothetical protein